MTRPKAHLVLFAIGDQSHIVAGLWFEAACHRQFKFSSDPTSSSRSATSSVVRRGGPGFKRVLSQDRDFAGGREMPASRVQMTDLQSGASSPQPRPSIAKSAEAECDVPPSMSIAQRLGRPTRISPVGRW